MGAPKVGFCLRSNFEEDSYHRSAKMEWNKEKLVLLVLMERGVGKLEYGKLQRTNGRPPLPHHAFNQESLNETTILCPRKQVRKGLHH